MKPEWEVFAPQHILQDVTRLETVDFVMKHGRVHKLAGQRQPFP